MNALYGLGSRSQCQGKELPTCIYVTHVNTSMTIVTIVSLYDELAYIHIQAKREYLPLMTLQVQLNLQNMRREEQNPKLGIDLTELFGIRRQTTAIGFILLCKKENA